MKNKYTYEMENLHCAHCAAKMEEKINNLSEVESATITFTTKKLQVVSANGNDLMKLLQDTCNSIEDGVVLKKVTEDRKKPSSKKVSLFQKNKKDITEIALGVVISLVGTFMMHHEMSPYYIVAFVVAYLILGRNIVITAGKNIMKKQMLDENFLMSIATLGAFAIGEYTEAVGVMIFYRIGELFEEAAVEKSRTQIMEAADLRPDTVNLIVEGEEHHDHTHEHHEECGCGHDHTHEHHEECGCGHDHTHEHHEECGCGHDHTHEHHEECGCGHDHTHEHHEECGCGHDHGNAENIKVIDAKDVNVGDIVLVKAGDRIPLDGVIVEGSTVLDTSAVTGESKPFEVNVGDEIYSGCMNVSGVIKVRVTKTLKESMVSRILDSVESASAQKPKMDRFITRFSKVYTPCVVALAAVTAIIPSIITGDWQYWIYTALTFLVISCPCAIVLSVPLAFFAGIGAGSKKGILFKSGVAIETLNEIKAVVMDKTGTITKGAFEVKDIIPSGDYTKEELMAYACSCEIHSNHPIAKSIVNYGKENDIRFSEVTDIKEVSGKGIICNYKGEELICGNKSLLLENGIAIDEKNISGTEVYVSINKKYVGKAVVSDIIKVDAKEAVENLNKKDIYTVMLTGDSDKPASLIAKEAGVKEYFSKLLPHEKLDKLKEVRRKHGKVMFVGDGINDAPVIAGADAGAAMGSGSDAAIEAADILIMNSNMSALPESIAIAKSAYKAAKANVIFALVVKALVVVLGFCNLANMWMAVFADTGVAMICILNSIRILYRK